MHGVLEKSHTIIVPSRLTRPQSLALDDGNGSTPNPRTGIFSRTKM
jgi:hypothetical protein